MLELLKEWAIVCNALGDGRQIFVARKGGISEDEGEFVLTNREFFLFPGYIHQNRESLKPNVHLELEMTSSNEPMDGKIHLREFARVSDFWKVRDFPTLQKLDGDHIWNDRFLRQRFEWGNELGLSHVVLRVYRLSDEIVLPMKKEYGGCKSWVTVPENHKIPAMSPVLSDAEFAEKRDRLFRLVKS